MKAKKNCLVSLLLRKGLEIIQGFFKPSICSHKLWSSRTVGDVYVHPRVCNPFSVTWYVCVRGIGCDSTITFDPCTVTSRWPVDRTLDLTAGINLHSNSLSLRL